MDRRDSSEVRVVAEWHEALNAGDVERLLELSSSDVEVGGPRGAGRGAELLRDWATGAGIRLVPRRLMHSDAMVVAEEEASWTLADTGETTPAQIVASVFVVRDGLVESVIRHDDLASALRSAGLDNTHAIEDQ